MEKETNSNNIQSILFLKNKRLGALFIILALVMVVFFTRNLDATTRTTLNLTHASSSIKTNDLVLNSKQTITVIAIIIGLAGIYQLIIGFKSKFTLVLGIVFLLFTFGFIVWSVSGSSINITGLLSVMVVRSIPLIIGAMAGILSERSGVVNIAIEGMMLSAAFTASVVASLTNLWIGLLIGILTGGLIAWIHATMCVKYKANNVISGTIINLFAIGITSYFSEKYIQSLDYAYLNNPGFFFPFEIPMLSKIPVIGPVFFNQNIFAYLMYILVIVLNFAIFQTKWGLRLRSVGEHPKAADTLGIKVNQTRTRAVILSGLVAGLGGSFFSIGSIGSFNEQMTAGRGFIALAAMIFGKWNPINAAGGGLLFGFAESISLKLAIFDVAIPSKILAMLPYVITIIVLGGVVGRNVGPAAGGQPYETESK